MTQCVCLKEDGRRCTRAAAKRGRFCWQHQKCRRLAGPGKAGRPSPTIAPGISTGTLKCPRFLTATKEQLTAIKGAKRQYPRKLQLLSGPFHFAFFPDLLGKRLLLLGETHSDQGFCSSSQCQQKQPGCYEVHTWLRDLALEAPNCLDLFV